LPLLKKLIDNGIDINAKDEYGLGALHIASFKGANEAAFFLIDRNIDLNIQDKSGQTVLHYAALNNQVELAKLALKKGALLSLEDMHGNQPIWTAVFNDKGRNDRIKIITLFWNMVRILIIKTK
jgi:ankyrin repeat protein